MSTEVGAATETVQVLHVDSDPAVTRQLRATVGADQQFAVVGEADERAALDSVESGTPDCVVVGHDPPETDGVAFVERLREDHPELPVVLFTANGSEQVASRAISAGVTDYVPATSAVGGATTANEETTSAEEGATSPADGTANAEAAATATDSAYHTLTERLREMCDVASTGQETAETAGQTGAPAGEHTTEQVERFAELFPGVAFVIDETGRYRDLLAGDEESLLYSDAEALVGRTFDDVLPPETAERFGGVVREVVESGQRQRIEYSLDVQAGERWFEAQVGPFTSRGELETVFWVARDITERKRRKQRLEVFNRVLRHNLRNQADVVDSHAEELLQRDRRGNDEESLVREHAERIRAASERLAGVSRRARTIDRILSEGLDTRRVDLGACLAETLDRVDRPEADADVTTSVPEDATLASDRRLLIAVFESALDNAVTHARSRVQVEATRTTDGWQVVIDDDGGGIPQAELDVIASGTETDLQHSRGLGLWQLKWGVEKLDGSLAFDVDDGTTVRITVPDRDVCGNS